MTPKREIEIISEGIGQCGSEASRSEDFMGETLLLVPARCNPFTRFPFLHIIISSILHGIGGMLRRSPFKVPGGP